MSKIFLTLALLVVACTKAVVLVNPETGQMVQCGPYSTSAFVANANALRERQCIEDYKEQGYVRR